MMRLRKAWSLHKGLFKSPDSSIVLRFYSKKRVGTSAQGAGGEAGGGGVVLPRYIVQGTRGLEVDVGLLDSDMEQTAKALESKFAEFRTGRFPLSLIENMKLHIQTKGASGTQSLGKLGTVMAKDPQTIIVNLFDSSVGKLVVAALVSSGNDLSATLEGSKVSITLPKITRERRERLAGGIREQTEIAKRALRDIRASLLKSSATLIKDMNLRRQVEMELERLYSAKVRKIDLMSSEKQKEVLSPS